MHALATICPSSAFRRRPAGSSFVVERSAMRHRPRAAAMIRMVVAEKLTVNPSVGQPHVDLAVFLLHSDDVRLAFMKAHVLRCVALSFSTKCKVLHRVELPNSQQAVLDASSSHATEVCWIVHLPILPPWFRHRAGSRNFATANAAFHCKPLPDLQTTP